MANVHAIDHVLRVARGAWRCAAPSSIRGIAQPAVLRLIERRVNSELARPEPSPKPGPLIVSGLFNGAKGVSEGARLTLTGLRSAGFDPVAHNLMDAYKAGPGAHASLPVDEQGGVWLVHGNAPEAIMAMGCLSPRVWRGRRRIAYWAWELPRLPPLWVRAANAFHEIWTPSSFTAEAAIASGVKRPVRVMPHPVALQDLPVACDRAMFNLPSDCFIVLSMGDLKSSADRKNLLGAIEVFRRTFPQPSSRARLIVKVQAMSSSSRFRREALQAMEGRPDIVLMTETLSRARTRALIACVDVLLSPHRAEGFGLPLAEAFLMGSPALATGWSGNLDFMSDVPELLISSTLVPAGDGYGVYRGGDGQVWAEPDIDDASRKLSALAASSELRDRLARRGRAAVEAQSAVWSRDALAETGLEALVA